MSEDFKHIVADWFLVTIKYTKQTETGEFKRVSENFLISAVTFGDAETNAFKYLDDKKIIGDIFVTAMKRDNYNEVILNDTETFYKMVITYLSTDDKKIRANFLVEADKIEEANAILTTALKEKNYQGFEIVNASLSTIKAVVNK